MQEKCNKCDSEELFVEIQGNRRGLYVANVENGKNGLQNKKYK